jgi:hypothetical protein
MRRRGRRVRALALGAAIVAATAALGAAPGTSLRVTGEDGEVVLDVAVRPGDLVRLSFVHSSEHVRVVSVFRVEGAALVSVETRMEGFGPGLPAAAAAASGTLVSRERTVHARIPLLVGPGTGHGLAVGDRHLDLSSRVPAGRTAHRFTVTVQAHTGPGLTHGE